MIKKKIKKRIIRNSLKEAKLATGPSANTPIFVYGTLRHGNRLWRQYIGSAEKSHKRAVLRDYILFYSKISNTYPTIVPYKGGQVVGDIIHIKPEYYEKVLSAVRMLEVYSSGYKEVVVTIDEEQALAYIATKNPYSKPDLAAQILSGDWNTTEESLVGRHS